MKHLSLDKEVKCGEWNIGNRWISFSKDREQTNRAEKFLLMRTGGILGTQGVNRRLQ